MLQPIASTCSPIFHDSRLCVERGKVALEGNISMHHGNASPHALKGTSPMVVAA